MLKRLTAIVTLLLLIPAAQAHFGLGGKGASPTAPAPPTVVAVNLGGSQTYPNGSPAGTSIGPLSVVMSSGSFSGSLALQNGGFDSFGTACDAANTTNFQIVGSTLELNTTLSGTYNVCVAATQGASTLRQAFTITGTSVSQTIASLYLTGGDTFAAGSGPGTLAATVGVTMLPTSPPFAGSLALIGTGTDQHGTTCTALGDFSLSGNNIILAVTLGAGTYPGVCVQATQGASTYIQAFTLIGATSAITTVSLQAQTFAANVPNIPVGALIPVLTNGNPFPSAPFTGSLAIVTTGTDGNGTTCTTNGNQFQILASSLKLAANGSGVSPGSYPGVCVQASQSGYTSWTQAFTLTAGAAPANQIIVTNVSGSTISNYHYQFGRAFLDGVIVSGNCPIININGTPAAQSQFDVKNAYADGSVRFGVGATVIPTLLNNTPVTLTFTSGACNNTALTQAQMLAGGFNFDGTEALLFPAAVLTGAPLRLSQPSLGAITNGGFDITINGTPLTITGLNFSDIFSGFSGTAVGTTLTVNSTTYGAVAVGQHLSGPGLSSATIVTANLGGGQFTINPGANVGPEAMTGIVSYALMANRIQGALNTALGTTATQAVQVWDLGGGGINLNEMLVISVLGPGSTISAATAGGGTDISAMLGWTSGTLYSNTVPTTTTISARTMLTNGNYALWTSGPVAQTIILADDSATAAYDAGNDGHHAFRPRIYATFWSGDNSVSLRFAGEQNKTTEMEDMSFGVTFSSGNISPTQQYQLDLSGTGNAFGEGQTGLTAASAKTVPISGALTVTGTLSGTPLTIGKSYYFDDLNISRWCQFTYTNSTTLTIADGCNQNFTNGAATNISIGDLLVVGNPKAAWTQSGWITPNGGAAYWINGSQPSLQVNIDPSLAYMAYSREVPNFDASVSLASSAITNIYSGWAGYNVAPYDGSWDGGPPNSMTVSTGASGASTFLGLMPNWQVFWLYTGDWRMRLMSLQQADLAAAYPNQIRETDPTRKLVRGGSAGSGLGLPVAIAGRPGMQDKSGNSPNKANTCTISNVYYEFAFCFGPSDNLPVIPGSAAISHGDPWISLPADHLQGTWRFPYVMTGDPWYLNEADLVVSFLEQGQNPSNGVYSRGSNGAYCQMVDQFRGEAWFGLRLAEAAEMAPDADPFKPWLQDCMNDLLAIWEGNLAITGTVYDGTNAKTWALPLKDAESSSGVSPSTLPAHSIPTLNEWDNFFDSSVTVNTFEKPGMWVPGVDLGIMDPWMYHYNTMALGREVELGFAAGPLQTYLGQMYHDLITTDQYGPYVFSQYGVPVEKQHTYAGGGFFADWPTLLSNAYTSQWLTGVGWNMSVTSMTWSGGQATLATALPNAVDAPAGTSVAISGATNSGSGGNAAVNGNFTAVSSTDGQHFTVAMPAGAGVIGTIGGTISAVINAPLLGPASNNWSSGMTTSGDGGRQVWMTPGEAMMTDNGIAPWGLWFGQNVHKQIADWSSDTHWDVVPRTDANTLPAQPTSTPP